MSHKEQNVATPRAEIIERNRCFICSPYAVWLVYFEPLHGLDPLRENRTLGRLERYSGRQEKSKWMWVEIRSFFQLWMRSEILARPAKALAYAIANTYA